ncbi:helix-turn-helix domain-containing protein [Paenibacillus turpanensis]|uniref:helix-turn-helix domain-containing protein n=1 Tax=Paenibacillus turpanensis TaxID=2689078 RepID=UPI00140DF50E|nr:helix-turn-helix domain-containing protein [Paenibacillus turpanensis]
MQRYLLRLLAFSFILGVIPAVMIGIVSYSIASRDLESKVKESHMQWLTQTQMRVEQMLKSIERSVTQVANSSLVNSAMNASYDTSDFEQVRALSSELYNLQSSDAVITQAYLVNLEQGWSLDLNTLRPFDQLEEKEQFQQYARETRSIQWIPAAAGERHKGPLLIEDATEVYDAKDTLTLVVKIPILPQTSTPKGLVVVKIAASDFRQALTPGNLADSNYIMDRSGSSILTAAATAADTDYRLMNEAIMKRLEAEQAKREGLFNTNTGDDQAAVIYRTSDYNGWTYVSVISIAEITKETRKIAQLTIIVCAIILLLASAFALYGSRRMYRPIQSLLEVAKGVGRKHEEETAPQRNDELDFIKESIESLADSRSRLQQQMIGQAGQLKEFFVLKLFTGQLTENDYIFRSDLYRFPTGWKHLGVLALQIDNLQDTKYEERDRELLLYAVNNIAQEVLPSSYRFTPIILNHSQVSLVATDVEHPSEVRILLYEAAKSIKEHAERYLKLRVSIGISKPYKALTDSVKAYGESLAALKARISLGSDVIIHYEDIENQPGEEKYVYTHIKVLEEQLVYTIREMELGKAVELFDQFLNGLLHKDGTLHGHQILLMQLVSRVLFIVQEQGISVKRVLKDDGAVERLLQLQTREEIRHWFESKLLAPIIQVLSEKTERQYVKIADKLIAMIQERYDQEITLEQLAEELNYHPVYVSRIFKKEIGTTFSDYLSDYRMQMAKVMLETTDMKISEIGEKLQYKNISAFIRGFRKLYDVTPGQYRERLGEKG